MKLLLKRIFYIIVKTGVMKIVVNQKIFHEQIIPMGGKRTLWPNTKSKKQKGNYVNLITNIVVLHPNFLKTGNMSL